VASLPSGTVTFVFSDIEGSTALLKRLGERYEHVLSDHRRLMRDTFGGHDGVEIDTQGDAFFFAFQRARDAVAAAVEAQRAHAAHEWPDGSEVRVRMGLHTGEPGVGREGYHGLDVVRAARLCGVGQGGHVLLSETTRALLGGTLPDGVTVFPLGERRLKDIDEPERVYELDIVGITPAASPMPESAPPPAAPPPPADDDFSARLSARIEEQVRRRVEASLERVASNVDELAARALERPEEITDRLEEESD
jgi:class 3 adenylate cyclase